MNGLEEISCPFRFSGNAPQKEIMMMGSETRDDYFLVAQSPLFQYKNAQYESAVTGAFPWNDT